MTRVLYLLLFVTFALAVQPSEAVLIRATHEHKMLKNSLTRTFHQENASVAAVEFDLTFAEFATLYAHGGLITAYHKTTDETYEEGYIYDMDVGFTDLSQSSAYQLPEIEFDGTWNYRLTVPADTRFGADFPDATHALVEEYEPGEYEDGYYYAEYYVIDETGIFQIGAIEVEGDGTTSVYNEPKSEETMRATFPLDETMGLTRITTEYDDDFAQDIQTRQEVGMHGFGTLNLGAQFDNETIPAGVFINDIGYQEPGETDPNEVIDFVTNYSIFGDDGTYLSFFVAIPECTDDDGCEVAFMGEIEITSILMWRISPANVTANGAGETPDGLSLGSAVPNPARGSARVAYRLPASGEVDLSVYDLLGRRVATLAQGVKPAGEHEATLSAGLSAGVYVMRLQAAGAQITQRVVVSR